MLDERGWGLNRGKFSSKSGQTGVMSLKRSVNQIRVWLPEIAAGSPASGDLGQYHGVAYRTGSMDAVATAGARSRAD